MTIKSKIICISFVLFVSIFATAQIRFEKGFFIDNSNTKIECLIKNEDWKNNPRHFLYKLNENEDAISIRLSEVRKFEIYNSSIYVRAQVDVNTNTSTGNKLRYSEKLSLSQKDVFLKVLVDGKSNLYLYQDANTRHFYYSLDDTIELLEYVQYINGKNQIMTNENFKSQLWNNLKCDHINMATIRSLSYDEKQLIKFMTAYNTCMNELNYTYKKEQEKRKFHLSVRPGLNFNQANLDTPGSNQSILRDFDFDNELSIRFGVELEYVLPFNKNKWALIIEPTYQYYKTDKRVNNTPNSFFENLTTATIDYSSIEIPIGIRHYSYLNTNSSLFFNFSVFFDLSFNSKIEYLNATYKSDTSTNLSFGVGYRYKSKYSIEGRWHSKRELLNTFQFESSKYSNVAVIFGYTIF